MRTESTPRKATRTRESIPQNPAPKLTADTLVRTFSEWPQRRAYLHRKHIQSRFTDHAVELLGDQLMTALATSENIPARAKPTAHKMLAYIAGTSNE